MNYTPSFLKTLDSLQFLNASKNKIRLLPSKIFESLTKLEKLDLSENRLVSIPYTFANLTSLTSLRLHFNKITSFPREICELSNITELSVFNLHLNGLSTLYLTFN